MPENDPIFEPLTFMAKDKRKVFVTIGGPASGKTSSFEKISECLLAEGVQPNDRRAFQGDEIALLVKPPALVPNDLKTQTNAFAADQTLRIMIKTWPARRILEKEGLYSHEIIEQAQISTGHLNADKLFITDIPVEVAIIRGTDRGLEIGTFSSSLELIKRHKQISADFADILCKGVEGQKNLIFEMLDNNVPKGEPAKIMASGDLAKAQMSIFDVDSMMEFAKKAKINVNATKEDELYKPEDHIPANNVGLLHALAKKFTISFTNRETGVIYAASTPQDGLQVYDGAMFERQMASDAGKAAFEALSRDKTRLPAAAPISKITYPIYDGKGILSSQTKGVKPLSWKGNTAKDKSGSSPLGNVR